ncbi:MAG: GDSL-type esterase/lipase family protein [Pygmaiobacter sp.]
MVRVKNYDRLTPKQRRKLMLTFLVPLAILTLLFAVLGFASCRGKVSVDPTDDSYTGTAMQGYGDVVLQKSEDAGQRYIDETVFAGDSNVVRLCNFGEIKLDNMLGYVGIGVDAVTEKECIWFEEFPNAPVTIVNAVKLMQPRRVLMMFGTNNTSWSTDDFIEEYGKAYSAIQATYPYADVIIAAVPPIGRGRENAQAVMKKIDSFNAALVKFAKEKNSHFLNGTEVLQGSDGYLRNEYSESDGLHLSARGLRRISNMCAHTAIKHGTQDRR